MSPWPRTFNFAHRSCLPAAHARCPGQHSSRSARSLGAAHSPWLGRAILKRRAFQLAPLADLGGGVHAPQKVRNSLRIYHRCLPAPVTRLDDYCAHVLVRRRGVLLGCPGCAAGAFPSSARNTHPLLHATCRPPDTRRTPPTCTPTHYSGICHSTSAPNNGDMRPADEDTRRGRRSLPQPHVNTRGQETRPV